MEPADYRWEHELLLLPGDAARVAAMEPAGSGGSAPGGAVTSGTPIPSQWSPPITGGSAAAVADDRAADGRAAMEPADYRREH